MVRRMLRSLRGLRMRLMLLCRRGGRGGGGLGGILVHLILDCVSGMLGGLVSEVEPIDRSLGRGRVRTVSLDLECPLPSAGHM